MVRNATVPRRMLIALSTMHLSKTLESLQFFYRQNPISFHFLCDADAIAD
jgi:hypothetical protein